MLKFFLGLLPKKNTGGSTDRPDLKVPAHIAVIMDGNGRWAQKKRLPRIAGHRVGVESLRAAVNVCNDLGVKFLTVYAFSTENWKRPKGEVDFLMDLLSSSIEKETEELNRKNARIRIFGRLDELEESIRNKIAASVKRTEGNTGLNLNILMNYGGRAEIVDAAKKAVELSKTDPAFKVDEHSLAGCMYMAGIPDPDLMIRTGGDMRVSNFLLWEIAYSEIHVADTLWPDFREKELMAAIEDFSKRKRRFGGINND